MVTNGYTTVAQLKAELGITDSADDTRLDRIVTSVSRMIDDAIGNHVYSVASSTRYFTATDPLRHRYDFGQRWRWGSLAVDCDPFTSLTSVAYDDQGDWVTYTAISSNNTYAYPFRAPTDERPYTGVRLTPGNGTTFPLHERGIAIAAVWGYGTTVPEIITEAAIMQCSLILRSQNAGGAPIAGGLDFSQPLVQAGLHPLVRRMIEPYRTGAGFGIA